MPPPIYELILDIRATFRALRAASDAMNEARGVTAARRAVMEFLAGHGPATVPQIAEAKSVTRQHIQTSADELVAQGLAAWSDNPAHRRSRLLGLSPQGARVFDEIRSEESATLDQVSAGMDPTLIEAGRKALQDLQRGLAALDRKTGSNKDAA
ncbi:MAG: MarR family transcriptional regulator [Tabrizicola sp.]|nr:MarR family transcriptional regulator [Tabrizicola sp.]